MEVHELKERAIQPADPGRQAYLVTIDHMMHIDPSMTEHSFAVSACNSGGQTIKFIPRRL